MYVWFYCILWWLCEKTGGDGGHTTPQLTWFQLFCEHTSEFFTLWDEMMKVFHVLMFDNWFIWLHWCLCCLTVAEFKPNILKPTAVTGFGDWKWRECPVSLTDVCAVATMRERAQTDTVNHPSIHWLTPLGTHTVSASVIVGRKLCRITCSLQSTWWHQWYLRFWSLVQEVTFYCNSIQLYWYQICYH